MWEISLVAFGAFFLTVAFLIEIARRVAANQRRMQNHVEELRAAVALRESELHRGFERIAAMQRVETLAEERRRIMQDMHDGVGGQLASLLVLSKDRALEPPRLLAAIRDGLADLRLIVDSLSQVDDDLAFALGSLRGRIAPQLRDAGIALHWAIDPATSLPGFGPQAVLQVFRVVQEAVNNALRHAEAQRIGIVFERVDAAIELRIEDDGVGMPDTPSGAGHGIGGMHARATKCGADFQIRRREQGGTAVVLRWATAGQPG
jgi:signal transduction histidine kinase